MPRSTALRKETEMPAFAAASRRVRRERRRSARRRSPGPGRTGSRPPGWPGPADQARGGASGRSPEGSGAAPVAGAGSGGAARGAPRCCRAVPAPCSVRLHQALSLPQAQGRGADAQPAVPRRRRGRPEPGAHWIGPLVRTLAERPGLYKNASNVARLRWRASRCGVAPPGRALAAPRRGSAPRRGPRVAPVPGASATMGTGEGRPLIGATCASPIRRRRSQGRPARRASDGPGEGRPEAP